ncbi:2788_t:CDS:2 [Entrophospora sp. SA101]|nr:2788_t:CDS:2 [Entrophospora sp. SA101]
MVFLRIGHEEVYTVAIVMMMVTAVKIPKVDKENDELLEQICKMVLMDRDLHKGTKAFISYVRLYLKLEANYIFRLKDLSCQMFWFTKIVRMPELTNAKIAFMKFK